MTDSSDGRTVLLVYGTRPEAIKMAPVVHELGRTGPLRPVVAVTGQHRSMLDQVNDLFGIVPDYDLGILRDRQSLAGVTTRSLGGLESVMAEVRPDVVVVQGDTTTAFTGALAAFYQGLPVVHMEAGLRTEDPASPFPEEINRRLTSQLADLHLTPTPSARANLLAEGIRPESVLVTGNTVIDALLHVTAAPPPPDRLLAEVRQRSGDGRRQVLLVTAHRRESWGEPLARVGAALARLAEQRPELLIVLPVHRNPVVRETVLPPVEGFPNILVADPVDYATFAHLMKAATVVLTDSGGIQEEAPSLGKPVLVLRDNTERPEGVQAGTACLVGTESNRIVAAVDRLLDDPVAYAAMAEAINPYGDGQAARRTVAAIAHRFSDAPAPDSFVPRPRTITIPVQPAAPGQELTGSAAGRREESGT
ncbi:MULTISPECIES: non-hydrolyzing UDP-N-acetylglucosamine 2-epimerase [unclassified Parafrankia]|uniref:non-hydrolyzing UDP-N-acetylglucosamine 2-epimerase n=1 Tax=unclassified Parafrankia TaxID=2994368 RepID=UPI000DA50192|nr:MULTISPECIES: UDP-N-acetylglucosamine 2-epimerase (non-hydrolyzing) [unclassified Parafrankia]TCJ34492.1 UDP-N-acetylglucosamine 2-epimerase (non-hydrolyzing) [Parafrankia sp. BMG5.11]SQD98720.1 UDP-N-acetyl glucosamine-2-epimerase [Parafrankia sp. Ea1.12]